jgi:cobalt-zinc-cadmium efflux system protein
MALVASYLVVELIGAWLSNSLALLADAGHTFADLAALGSSLAAMWLAERPPSSRHTYGYHRAEILAALGNGLALVVIAVFVLVEARARLAAPQEVAGGIMMGVAWGGLVINLAALRVLHGGQAESLNMRGAWLHVLNDTLGTLGTIIAAAAIWAFGWDWADPVASILVALLVLHSAWRLIAASVGVLMESTPAAIDGEAVHAAIAGVRGVAALHDLHVWTITSGLDALSVHVVAAEPPRPSTELLGEIRAVLHERFGIEHVTVQLEPPGFAANHTCDRCTTEGQDVAH